MSGICDTCWLRKGCSHKSIGNVDSCWRYARDKESNYQRFFGTPKRAARTLHHGGTLVCRECLIREECAKTPENSDCMILHYDTLLEWLKGDAE